MNTTDLNETFDVLTHPYRRYVLYYLTNEAEVVNIGTLVAAVAAWDGNHAGSEPGTDNRDVKTALHHIHFPKLVDAGIITVDEKTVSINSGETDGLNQFLGDTARIDGYSQTAADD